MNNKISTISKRMQEAMEAKDIKQAELCRATGIGKSSISTYISGDYEPKQTNLYKIANALGVSIAWLSGYDVPMRTSEKQKDLSAVSNIILPQATKVPILGSIAAGSPILAEENIEEYLYMDRSLKIDFCLKVKGDSMIDAGIYSGDIALFKHQQMVENGEIGAVVIDNEATLKKIYITEDTLVLSPCNSDYEPIVVKEGVNTYIAGKLIGVIHKY